MRFTLTFITLILFTLSGTVTAQDQQDQQPPKLVMSFFQCDWNDVFSTVSQMDSLDKPIWQELVDEGKLLAWGTAQHDFAGYENLIIYRVAPSLAAVEEAQEEFGRRFQERHPDAEPTGCVNHRDAIYQIGPGSGPNRDGFPNVVLSFYQCDNDKRGQIAAAIDSLLLPTVQELVEEDAFGTWGTAIHDWAGLETIMIYRSAKDRATFFESWAELNRRVSERHPDADPFLGCNRHRDGLYIEGPRTSPPPPPEEEDMGEAEE